MFSSLFFLRMIPIFFYSGKELKDIVRNVEREMEWVKKWFDINKLSLNMSKTKFMIWGKK